MRIAGFFRKEKGNEQYLQVFRKWSYSVEELEEGFRKFFEYQNYRFHTQQEISDARWIEIKRVLASKTLTSTEKELEIRNLLMLAEDLLPATVKAVLAAAKAKDLAAKKTLGIVTDDGLLNAVRDWEQKIGSDAFDWSGHNWQWSGDKARGCCPWHESDSGTSGWIAPDEEGIWFYHCPRCEIGVAPFLYQYKLEHGRDAEHPKRKEWASFAKKLTGYVDSKPYKGKGTTSKSNSSAPRKKENVVKDSNDEVKQEVSREGSNVTAEALDNVAELESTVTPEDLENVSEVGLKEVTEANLESIRLDYGTTEEEREADRYLVTTSVEECIFKGLFEGGKGDWVVINDAFYKYTGNGYWKHIPDTEVERLIAHELMELYRIKKVKSEDSESEVIVKGYATEVNKKNSYKFCRSALTNGGLAIFNEHLICFRNTTVDVRTGEQVGHSREHYLTSTIDCDYVPNSDCPEIYKNFITNVHGEEFLPLIRAGISMYIDPTSPYGYFLHFVGPSGSGKGTQIDLFGSFFGLECKRSLNSISDLLTPEKRHQYLTGARFVSFPDMGGRLTSLEPFYELVDNGSLSGRALFSSHGYEKFWSTRFIMASVELLSLENSGGGWDRRCIPIPTRERKGDPDPFLKSKLKEKRGEIISWALSMPRVERDAFLIQATKLNSIQELKREQAVLSDNIRAFLDQSLRPAETAMQINPAQLHDWYKAFCVASGFTPSAFPKFTSHLKRLLPIHFQDRKQIRIDGKREWKSAYWKDIEPVNPHVFISSTSVTGLRVWDCNKNLLQSGGDEDFEAWKLDKNNFVSQFDTKVSPVSPGCHQGEDLTLVTATPFTGQDLQQVSPVSPGSNPNPFIFEMEKIKEVNNTHTTTDDFYNLKLSPVYPGDTGDSAGKTYTASISPVTIVDNPTLVTGGDSGDILVSNCDTKCVNIQKIADEINDSRFPNEWLTLDLATKKAIAAIVGAESSSIDAWYEEEDTEIQELKRQFTNRAMTWRQWIDLSNTQQLALSDSLGKSVREVDDEFDAFLGEMR